MLLAKCAWVVGLSLGLVAGGTEIVACSSTPPSPKEMAPSGTTPEGPIPTSACTDGGLTVAFNPMYSAYDGKHIFQVPALVVGSNGSVTWSADSSLVGMQSAAERPNEVLITMLKPGNVIINVQSSDGKCGSSLLRITSAQESDWKIGSARYNNGISLHLSGPASGTGSPLEQGSGGPACTSCHGEVATNGIFTNVSHTPEQTGGFSDSDLINIIENGEFPDGGYFDPSIVTYPAWHNFHRWTDITPDQQKGIVVYLRSLTPIAQSGAVNFGALGVDAGSPQVDMEAGLDAFGDVGADNADSTSGDADAFASDAASDAGPSGAND